MVFKSLDSNQTARALPDVDISLINNGMATDAGLVPTEDAIFLEPVAESSKPYYNVIAARRDEKTRKSIKQLSSIIKLKKSKKLLPSQLKIPAYPFGDGNQLTLQGTVTN